MTFGESLKGLPDSSENAYFTNYLLETKAHVLGFI